MKCGYAQPVDHLQLDPTNPSYYDLGGQNAFNFITAVCKDLPGDEAICVDDILKYVIRYKKKNGLVDLKKALWYLNKLIDIVESKE